MSGVMTNEGTVELLDREVRQKSYASMGQDIQLVDDLILHINHGKVVLKGQRQDRGLNLLIGLLLSRAFNSLLRAREDAVLGYPGESLTLCRSAVEHWIASRWVELNPGTRDRWLWAILSEVTQPEERIPSPTAMLKELGDLAGPVSEIYDLLSKFAHPRGVGLRWVMHFDEQSTYFHSGPHFDVHALKMCLYFIMGTAQACLEPVARLQNRVLGSVDEDWLAEGRRLSDLAEVYMESTEEEIREEAEAAPEGGDGEEDASSD
jgi:hypothetical protein